MNRTIREQAKEFGITAERFFSLLYIDSERYRCMKCRNETKSSYSRCPKCGETFCYEELPPKFGISP